jgi:hypothetical protein
MIYKQWLQYNINCLLIKSGISVEIRSCILFYQCII